MAAADVKPLMTGNDIKLTKTPGKQEMTKSISRRPTVLLRYSNLALEYFAVMRRKTLSFFFHYSYFLSIFKIYDKSACTTVWLKKETKYICISKSKISDK